MSHNPILGHISREDNCYGKWCAPLRTSRFPGDCAPVRLLVGSSAGFFISQAFRTFPRVSRCFLATWRRVFAADCWCSASFSGARWQRRSRPRNPSLAPGDNASRRWLWNSQAICTQHVTEISGTIPSAASSGDYRKPWKKGGHCRTWADALSGDSPSVIRRYRTWNGRGHHATPARWIIRVSCVRRFMLPFPWFVDHEIFPEALLTPRPSESYI